MATNGPFDRGLSACTARANSSLPVPLSPSSSTVASVAAARCSADDNCFMGAASPMIVGAPRRAASSSFSRVYSLIRRRCASARSTSNNRWSGSTGLARKSMAPAFIAVDRVLNAAEGSHDDDRQLGSTSLAELEDAKPVSNRQPKVRQHDGGDAVFHSLERFWLIFCLDNMVALRLERKAQHRPERVLVFDEQNRCTAEAVTATSPAERRLCVLLLRYPQWPWSGRRFRF